MTTDVARRRLLIGLVASLAACGKKASGDSDEALATGDTQRTTTSAPTTTTSTVTAPPAPSTTEPPTTLPPDTTAPQPPTPATPAGPVWTPLVCRAAWGARPAAAGGAAHTIQRLTVHHSAFILEANSAAPQHLRDYQNLHTYDRGWIDIAYHVAVDAHGHIYELRSTDIAGDTATGYDTTGHFQLLAIGDFTRQDPTEEQLDGLAKALAWAAARFGVPLATISGHRDHASSACPGTSLYPRLGELRSRAEVYAGRSELTVRCGQEGASLVSAIESGQA